MAFFGSSYRYIIISCVIISSFIKTGCENIISYNDLGNQIINAYGIIEHGISRKNPSKAGITKQELRRIIYPLLATLEDQGQKTFINESICFLMRDLALFISDDGTNEQSLFSKINFTSTIFGEAVLAKMLVSLTTDTIRLQARQNLVRMLLEDENLFNELDSLINNIKKIEQNLCSFWHDDNSISKSVIRQLFYNESRPKNLNKSPLALELLTRCSHLISVCDVFRNELMEGAVIYGIGQGRVSQYDRPSFIAALWQSFKMNFDPREMWSKAKQASSGQLDGVLSEYVSHHQLERMRNWASKVATMKSFNVFFNYIVKYWSIKSAYERAKLHMDTTNTLHTRLIDVANCVTTLKKINRLLDDNVALANGLMHHKKISILFDRSVTQEPQEFEYLIELLQTKTFTGKASFFSYTGRVLAVYKLMTLHKDKFAGAFEAIGEIDACLSIVKLYKEFEHQRVHYTFAQFYSSDTPYLKLDNFWNLQIDPTIVVPNSIELGYPDKYRNIILTGSNTGGKSTLLKAVATTVLLSQTIGIAPADFVGITPFMYLGTSFNIIDNIVQGKSLYQAEVERAASLINAAATLNKNQQFCCLLIDELFRGTSPEKADQETHERALALAGLNNTCYILATHFFNRPIQLEYETHGICKNFKIDASVDNDGNIVRTFTLQEGVSQHSTAEDILRKALMNNR